MFYMLPFKRQAYNFRELFLQLWWKRGFFLHIRLIFLRFSRARQPKTPFKSSKSAFLFYSYAGKHKPLTGSRENTGSRSARFILQPDGFPMEPGQRRPGVKQLSL